ncbi:MAG: hypothetical protein A2792_19725 [Sphingomonadales bacterium RIFCSPHIGHO2_01_FULL_65_20]|nr:MAG: hypothetical protein A2792_19725 [Sphingomonadales bacterium RIFCSPHIGHO2_01_FULL_65_20]
MLFADKGGGLCFCSVDIRLAIVVCAFGSGLKGGDVLRQPEIGLHAGIHFTCLYHYLRQQLIQPGGVASIADHPFDQPYVAALVADQRPGAKRDGKEGGERAHQESVWHRRLGS